MNRDEIMHMARDIGFAFWHKDLKRWMFEPGVERFFQDAYAAGADAERKFWMEQIKIECNEAVLAEREACAEICDRFQARDVGMKPAECAGAIRARGNK